MHDYYNNGSYSVTLTIADSSGVLDSISKTLIVATSTPTVYLGQDTIVCTGTIVTLDAGPQPGCSYYWSTGEISQTIHVNSSGNYWVQVYNSTCSANSSVNVIVKPPLSSEFKNTQLSSCPPLVEQFTDSSKSCNSTVVFWQWDFGDGTSSFLANPVHAYNDSGNYVVQLTVRDLSGHQVTSNKNIYVGRNTELVNLGNDTTICSGNTLTVRAGEGFDSYLWNNGATASSINVTDSGLYWVQVTKGGCSGWDSIRISTVFPFIPKFGSEITSKCLPVLVHFRDSSFLVCGDSPIHYWLWDFGDGSSSMLKDPDHIYLRTGFFTVRLIVRNAKGMERTSVTQIEIKTTGPVVDLGPDITVCAGNPIQLDAGNSGGIFKWSPAQFLSNDTIQKPVAFPRATTLFIAKVTKCGVEVDDSIRVYVDSLAKPSISQTEGNFLTGSLGVSYQWFKDESILKGATSREFKPQCVGYYKVAETSTRGCQNISDSYFFLPAGGHMILPGNGKIKVQVSPNPAHGKITIYFSAKPSSAVLVTIFDGLGRVVFQGKVNEHVNSFDLSHLRSGNYWIELRVNDQKITIPISLL